MSQYFYFWSEEAALKGTMARSLFPGPTAPEFEFIKALTERVTAISVNATHIHWSSTQIGGSPTPSINRSKVDGTEVEKAWMTWGGKLGFDVVAAVDESHVYYALSKAGASETENEIGRAKLDGSEETTLIKLPGQRNIVSIVVDGEHIYWLSGIGFGEGEIGRAKLDGSEVEEGWMKLKQERGRLALNSTHVYFLKGEREVGRVKKDGTEFEEEWYEVEETFQGIVATNSHIYLIFWNEGAEKAYLARLTISPKAEELNWLSLGTIFKGQQPEVLALSPEEEEEKPPPVLTCPGPQTTHQGESVTLKVEATHTTEYKATGLPAGLSINAGTGEITGTVTTIEKVKVKLTVKGSGGSDSCEFEWTILEFEKEEGVGDEWSFKGDPVHVQVRIPGTTKYKATGLPTGLTMSESGLITGTPTVLGTTAVEVTAE